VAYGVCGPRAPGDGGRVDRPHAASGTGLTRWQRTGPDLPSVGRSRGLGNATGLFN
jgi:hypothetical protein